MTNQITFVLLSNVIIIGIVFLAIQITTLAYLCLISSVLYVLPFIFNALYLQKYARFCISLLPGFIVLVMHCIFIIDGKLVSILLAGGLMCTAIPWVLFDLKEKRFLMVAFGMSSLFLFILKPLSVFAPMHISPAIFDVVLVEITINLVMVVIFPSLLYILKYDAFVAEQKNDVLIYELKEQKVEISSQNEELTQQQEELIATQEEMKRKQQELEMTNRKIEANESILKKSLEKLKVKEAETQQLLVETQEQQAEITAQNEELYQQKEEINAVNESLKATLQQLQNTTSRLSKSINYAQNIQRIVLPKGEELGAFFKEYLTIYLPKDIVSGDFYWFHAISERQSIFIMADCTGHGVPGAFMSMIANTLLKEIVSTRKIIQPAAILHHLHHGIRYLLKQEESRNMDGMDLSICLFTKEAAAVKVDFSGAKSFIISVKGNDLQRFDSDRISVGGIDERVRNFTNQTFDLHQGDLIYFLSDGFIDQNNAERLRFGTNNFKQLIYQIHDMPLENQKKKIVTALENHQQEEEQRDDISVVGFRI
jgi:serine phosphatase RsbU (regulator of sigma subunit)